MNPITNFKEKPSAEMLKAYKQTLEKILSAHNASIKIELWDDPSIIKCFKANGDIYLIEYLWIKNIKISIKHQKTEELSVSTISNGIDENTNEKSIWLDAHHIQDQIYSELGLNYTLEKSDPYWRLWDFKKKNESI